MIAEIFLELELLLTSTQLTHQHFQHRQQHSSATSTTTSLRCCRDKDPSGKRNKQRSCFRTWISKEQEVPGSATDLHRPLCLLLPHREQGAAEEPHGPSLDSPSTDSPSTLTTARGHIPLPAQRPSMEVTTMFASPASTTEGDDLCETDLTDVAIHNVTLLICLCGLAGNGAVISLLSLKSRNTCFFNMAVIDFIFLLFGIPSALLFLVEDVSCSPILPLMYLNFLLQLSVVSCYWGLFRVMRGSILDLIDSLFCLCCHWQLPLRLRWVMDSAQYWAFFALFAVIPSMTFLCPAQQQEHCQAAFISMYSLILLLFVAPMVISSTVDFIKAKRGSQQQQLERSNIVIFPIVLFTFLYTICNFLQELGYLTVPSQVVFLLACINSSIKPFIYFLMGRCRRPCSVQSLQLSVQRVFEEPKENPANGECPAMDMGV